MKIKFSVQSFAIWIVLIGFVILFSTLSPVFLKPDNLFNIGKQVAVLGIVSVGMACVIVTGGIDLSVGSLLALNGVIGAMLIVNTGWDPLFAVLVAIMIGILSGAISGIIIVFLNIPPLIATLAMMTIIRGLVYIVSKGRPIYGLPEGFTILGQGYIWLIPIPMIFMFIIFMIGSFFMNNTCLGRYIYAVGGNEEVTRMVGINVKKVKILVYVISGFLTSVAGVLLLARLNSGQPTVGTDTALDVITAVVLGGVSISGGEGKISGVLAGALIIGVISNGLIIMNVGEFYQMVVKGIVLIIAVSVDQLTKKYRKEVRTAGKAS